MELYPLKFSTIYKHKVWGGRALEQFDRQLPEGSIGESWLLSGLPDDDSVVLEGPLSGKTLSQLIHHFKDQLLGLQSFKEHGLVFPLLIKILDASDWLSLQIHPEEALVSNTIVKGKEEIWYVLDALPFSEIILGLKEGTDKAEYQKMLEKDNLKKTSLLNHFYPKKGDLYLVETGIIHAIGKGLLILEVQEALDITYRVYDWGRENKSDRPLHREEAFSCIKFPAPKQSNVQYEKKKNTLNKITSRSSFSINYLNISGKLTFSEEALNSFKLYICIAGSASISFQSKQYLMKRGELLMIPSVCTAHYDIFSEKSGLLEVSL